jgi:uncharacterized membrane protein
MEVNTQLGLKSKVLAAISYLILFFGWIGLIIDILIGYSFHKDRYVRSHSSQAGSMGLIITIIQLVLAVILIGKYISSPFDILIEPFVPANYVVFTLGLLTILIYAGCAILAFMGKEFRIPVIAKLAWK